MSSVARTVRREVGNTAPTRAGVARKERRKRRRSARRSRRLARATRCRTAIKLHFPRYRLISPTMSLGDRSPTRRGRLACVGDGTSLPRRPGGGDGVGAVQQRPRAAVVGGADGPARALAPAFADRAPARAAALGRRRPRHGRGFWL